MRIERDKAIHNISYRKLDKSDRAGIEKLATELHNFHAMLEPERFTRIERYTIEGDYDISYGAFENESLIGIALEPMTQILGRVRLHSLVIYMSVKNIGVKE